MLTEHARFSLYLPTTKWQEVPGEHGWKGYELLEKNTNVQDNISCRSLGNRPTQVGRNVRAPPEHHAANGRRRAIYSVKAW